MDGDITQVTIMCHSGSALEWLIYPDDLEHFVFLDRSLSKYEFSENTLIITNASRTDEGIYYCLSGDNTVPLRCIYVYGEFVSRTH